MVNHAFCVHIKSKTITDMHFLLSDFNQDKLQVSIEIKWIIIQITAKIKRATFPGRLSIKVFIWSNLLRTRQKADLIFARRESPDLSTFTLRCAST